MNTLLNAGFLELTPSLLPGAPHGEEGQDVLSLLMDTLAHGVVVVSDRAQVIHANKSARKELDLCRVLRDMAGEIHAVNPLDGKALQTALAKAMAGKRSLVTMTGEGLSLMLAVVPLAPARGLWSSRIALFLSRPEVCESGMVGFFARSHGLTQTEEQVLTILCRGLSTPEIAVQMKVAVSTIRSHVRSLCAKTGSSGVRELVNRVAVLPPVAPPDLARVH